MTLHQGDYSFAAGGGGALSGAATGAAIGSAIPGIGTAIGAIAGGVIGALGGFGGGAEAPSPFGIAKRAAVNMGLVPPGEYSEFYFKRLIGMRDPQAMQLAVQAGIDPALVRKWQTTDPKTWKGAKPESYSLPARAAIAPGVSIQGGPNVSAGFTAAECQCDERPKIILAQLMRALGY